METRQAIFTETYCDTLRNNLRAGESIGKYIDTLPHFDYTDNDLCYLTDFEVKTENLRAICTNTRSNLENAILLYEAFPKLTPLLASYEPFWLYFSHADLFEYLRKRWPNILSDDKGEKDIEKQKQYIRDYWFQGGSSIRSWLSGLWWSVYLTGDESRPDKYELTRVLFRQEDLRTRTFGTYMLFRHKPATVATLTFINDHIESTFKHSFQNRCRYMMKYLNYLGGCRQLSYMDQSFFMDMLVKKNADIAKVP